jgi:hypothetical protein
MSDEAGREQPPASTRFRKGHSGNPRGRPRKQPDARPSAFDVVIDRTLTIVQDGVPREVTVDEALQHKTYQDAIAGNRAARREVLKMIAKREKAITEKTPPANPVEVHKEGEDPRNADEALLILGIACRDSRWSEPYGEHARLLLDPWAVEAALSRRAGSRLDRKDIGEARRCTRDADTLRWPEADWPEADWPEADES